MAAYQHMLVAIDLTDESKQVLDRARDEAQRHGAKLSLVHVIKPFLQVYGGYGVMGGVDHGGQMATLEVELQKQAREQLARIASDLVVPAERTHALNGNPAAEIRALVESSNADLLIIGTHGRHGLGLLLGSTANAVLHGIQCDVLVVRVLAD